MFDKVMTVNVQNRPIGIEIRTICSKPIRYIWDIGVIPDFITINLRANDCKIRDD
jgi:hypothetical protein